MKKEKIIGKIRMAAEKDLTISDGALRLLFRLCSHIYVNPKAKLENPFPLPWSQVAVWCALKDADASARRIAELVDAGYLKCDGLRGCPPTNHFFLISNYRSGTVIDCRSGGVINSCSGAVNNYRSGGVHHISNSFQEEKIKRKRGEIKSSLRSKVTKETEELAEQARTVGEKQRQLLSQLRGTLGHTAGKSNGSAQQ